MDELKRIRKEKDVSVDELIKLLGLRTKSAYYKKEAGMTKFSLDEAKMIADRLGMKIEEIFFGTQVYKIDI